MNGSIARNAGRTPGYKSLVTPRLSASVGSRYVMLVGMNGLDFQMANGYVGIKYLIIVFEIVFIFSKIEKSTFTKFYKEFTKLFGF